MSTTAPKSRTGLIIIIVVALIIVGIVVWYFFFRGSACDPNKNGYTKKGKYNLKCKFEDPAATNVPHPTGTSGWTSDSSFPLKKGSWGAKVSGLQIALGLPEGKCSTCADGRFGLYTEGKLKAKTGKTEVATQAEYDAIVSPSTTSDQGGKNYEDLKVALGSSAKDLSAGKGVYVDVQGENKNYVFSFWKTGEFFFSLPVVQTAIKQGTYSNGGKNMKIDGDWFAYTEGSVDKNMKKITKDLGE